MEKQKLSKNNSIYMISENQIKHILIKNNELKTIKSKRIPYSEKIISDGEFFYMRTRKFLKKLDQDLTILSSYKFQKGTPNKYKFMDPPTTISIFHKYIIFSYYLKIFIFTKDFKLLSVYNIEDSELLIGNNIKIYKGIDDIIGYNDNLYIIDNTLDPLYLFKIKINESLEMKLEAFFEYICVNEHFTNQFLNPLKNQWFTISESGTRGGKSSYIRLFDMYDEKISNEWGKKGNIKSVSFLTTCHYSRYNSSKRNNKNFNGIRILDVLPIYPNYAIIINTICNVYICELEIQTFKLQFSNRKLLFKNNLPISENTKIDNFFKANGILRKYNEKLYVYLSIFENNLFYIYDKQNFDFSIVPIRYNFKRRLLDFLVI